MQRPCGAGREAELRACHVSDSASHGSMPEATKGMVGYERLKNGITVADMWKALVFVSDAWARSIDARLNPHL